MFEIPCTMHLLKSLVPSTGSSSRNFSWNFAFFEWKRALHNALATRGTAPEWAEPHFDWLRRQEPKDAANVLTFEAACLAPSSPQIPDCEIYKIRLHSSHKRLHT